MALVRSRLPERSSKPNTSTTAVSPAWSVYFDDDHMGNQFSVTLASALLRHLPHT